MGFFNSYPYTDFHELNLDMMIREIFKLRTEFTEFKHLNQITLGGVWDITKQYPAWCIVNDGYWEYISLRPVPIGIDITNRDYWMVIGRYSEQIEELFRAKTNERVNFLSSNETAFYVKGITGNDDNDGKTEDTAFKTLDHALEVAAFWFSDIRIFIYEPGTYHISTVTIGACNLHIHAKVAGTTILQFENEGSLYGAHVNFRGYSSSDKLIVTTQHTSNTWYMDGGDIVANDVDFQCIFRMNGGAADLRTCTLRNIYCNGANFIINNGCIFEDPFVTNQPAIRIHGGFFTAGNDVTFNLSHDFISDETKFLLVRSAYVDFTAQITNTSGYVYYGNDVNQCCFITNPANMTALKNMAASQNIWGPIIKTNLLLFKRKYNTTTTITSNSWTPIGSIDVDPGYCRLDICILTPNNNPSDHNCLVRTVSTDGQVPSTYQTLVGVTGQRSATHIYVECNRTTSFHIDVEIQNANGLDITCIIDRLTETDQA